MEGGSPEAWRTGPLASVAAAQRGDREAREELLRAYTPFILRVASQVAGRWVAVGQDEEVSVAFSAFNEAIDAYRTDQGTSFLHFAETVVKRRLIDLVRRQERYRGREVVLSELEPEPSEGGEETAGGALDAAAEAAWRKAEEDRQRRWEVEELGRQLAAYAIAWTDLVREGPRHRDARQRALAVARALASDRELVRHLLERRELPVARLLDKVPYHRKTLERHRKYIIAAALIWILDLRHLGSYLAEESPHVRR
ncbi:MAG: RNA polymerase subunit sigma [Firmicutes bacterium]|nr:RNA polymerase subunit sigma [Alicyclobacillaceae bacterium]MCL6498186.1 RNA polymerase subunit sigma [Bacillota bacterium]